MGVKYVEEKKEGTGGTFTYCRLSSKPLMSELRDFGTSSPSYEDIAKYIFYTETSSSLPDKPIKNKLWFVGEYNGRSYYLLYDASDSAGRALDMEFLKKVASLDKNRELVIYCEKVWVHRSDIREWEQKQNKRIRLMIVPFNLR